MKKQYTKPMVAVEFYKLSQSIAACTIKIGYTNSQCVVNDPDAPEEMRSMAYALGVFSDGCDTNYTTFVQPGGNDTLCYHTQTNATFTS